MCTASCPGLKALCSALNCGNVISQFLYSRVDCDQVEFSSFIETHRLVPKMSFVEMM